MSDASNKEIKGRKEWRGLLIPAVGSAAFFSSMLVNVLKTHRKHGWPKNAFGTTDYILMAIPFAIIALALHEEVNNTD